MLVAAGSAAAADSAPAPILPVAGVDHVSVRVANLEKSAQFYQSLFGLAPMGADKEHNILRLGAGRRVIVSCGRISRMGRSTTSG